MAWITEIGGQRGNYFNRNIYHPYDEEFDEKLSRFAADCNNTDVYQCAYLYENDQIETCKMIGCPYLDFDIDHIEQGNNYQKLVDGVKYVVNYLEMALSMPAEEMGLYFSGHKGFHLILPFDGIGITPDVDLNDEFRYFAYGVAFLKNGRRVEAVKEDVIDLQIYDRKRLFRIPGSKNGKSGLYKVPVSMDQLYEFGYEEMKEWASAPREEIMEESRFRPASRDGYINIIEAGMEYEARRDHRARKKKGKKKMELKEGEVLELLPCAKYLLEHGAVKGTRNHSCFALASSLYQAGYSGTQVFEMIEEWNDRNDEPLADRELQVTIGSAAHSYESGMTVGCGKYKDLDLCQEDCKLLSY